MTKELQTPRLVTILYALLDARTVALVLPAAVLAALWGQSYLGGVRSYYLGYSESGWFNFLIGGGHGVIEIPIPYWLPTLPAILVAFLAIRASVRRLPIVQGFCLHCGYDLRASPERCP